MKGLRKLRVGLFVVSCRLLRRVMMLVVVGVVYEVFVML